MDQQHPEHPADRNGSDIKNDNGGDLGPGKPGPKDRLRSRMRRLMRRPLALLALAVLSACLLAGIAFLALYPAPPAPETALHEGPVRQEAVPPGYIYEERQATGIQEQERQADYAILEALADHGIPSSALNLLDVRTIRDNGDEYHYQKLRIHLQGDRPDGEQAFLASLRARLAGRAPEAMLAAAEEPTGEHAFTVTLGGHVTHRLLLDLAPIPVPEPEHPKGPLLAIVIDDMGEDLGFAKGLAAMKLPICFSVWPNSSHHQAVAALAKAAGRELLVHLPMQPRGYPKVDPGKDPLLVTMTDQQIRDTVRSNLAKIPGAVGVNNHMGSQFTAYRKGMRVALKEIQGSGLYFLDSLTTGSSVGESVAHELGLECYVRDVFLDNVRDVDAILHQMHRAERIARLRGKAIAIGHPHPETLEALRRWAASRDASITVVPVHALPRS